MNNQSKPFTVLGHRVQPMWTVVEATTPEEAIEKAAQLDTRYWKGNASRGSLDFSVVPTSSYETDQEPIEIP